MIDHVNVVVSDIERSALFYAQVLGLRRGFERLLEGAWIDEITSLRGVRARCLFLESEDGGARLELLQFLSPPSLQLKGHGSPHAIGARHVAWAVEDVAQVLERLRAWGSEPLSEPVEVPFVVGSLGRKRLCYFRDPDGTLLEVASYNQESAADC